MMQLTEEQRKALIEECQAVIEYGGFPSPSIYEIALASLRLPDEITLKDAPRLLDDDEQRCWVAGAHYMRNQVARLNASAPEDKPE